MMRPSLSLLLLGAALALDPGRAEVVAWNQYRGPDGSGVAEHAQPPVKPDESLLAWKIPLPPGLSSPVLAGGLLFLTALDAGRLVTLAIDAETGALRWRREAPEVPLETVHQANHPASSSAHADAQRVYVYFGSYGMICYDHEGNQVWTRTLPNPQSLYGMSTSPIGHGDHLFLVLDDDANLPASSMSRSSLLALQKSDGSTAWESPRPLQRSGWSTPAIWRHGDGEDLIVLGSGRAVGYDPATGAEKWFVTGFSRETIAVPVQGRGHLFLSSSQLGGGADAEVDPKPFWNAMLPFDRDGDDRIGRDEITEHFTWPLRPELPLGHPGFGLPLPDDPAQRRERQDGIFGWVDKDRDGFWTSGELAEHMSFRPGRPLLIAVRPGGTGDVTASHVAWELNRGIPEIPSPIFYQDHLYLVRNGGLLCAVDAGTGEQLYRGRLPGSGGYSASPVAANGHLYLLSDLGVVSVVKAGPTFDLAHHHDLGETSSASPALDHNTIYFRTKAHLWAFRARK